MLFIPFTVRGNPEKVLINDINYIKSEGRKILISATCEDIHFYGNLTNVVPILDDRFYQCHGRLFINLSRIDRFETKAVCFFDGSFISIGVNNLRKAKNVYREYIRLMAYEKIGESAENYDYSLP